MMKKALAILAALLISVLSFALLRFLPNNADMLTQTVKMGMDSIPNDLSTSQIELIVNEISLEAQLNIIKLLEDERSKYIDLITVISILLTVFTLFSIVNGILEKRDIETLAKDMESKIKEYERKIKGLSIRSSLHSLETHADGYLSNSRLLLEGNLIVDSYEKLLQYYYINLSFHLDEMISNGLIEELERNIKNKIWIFSNSIVNYIFSACQYANRNGFMKQVLFNANDNDFIKEALKLLRTRFSSEMYSKIKKCISEISPDEIDFNDY